MVKPRTRRRPARQRMIEVGRRKIDTVRTHGLFVLHGDGVICETVKQGEDGGVVVRLYECLGGDAGVSIQCPYEIYSCTLTEEQPVFLAASEARLQFAPFEIKTLLLKPLKG